MTEQSPTPHTSSPPAGILALGSGFLFLLLLSVRWITRSSFWTHLVTGRWVAESGIPRADLLSFTAEGESWVAGSWLYDWLLVQLWNGGPATVIVVHAVVALAAFALLIPVSRTWATTTAIGCGLLLSGWLLAPTLDAAPHTFALLFPALFIFLLSRNRSPSVLWPGILIGQVLWTNIHGSFVLGPVICLAFAAGSRRQGDDAIPMKTLVMLAAASMVATLLNPYGPGLHSAMLRATSDPTSLFLVSWISPISNLFGSTLAKNLTTLALAIGAGGLLLYKQPLPIGITSLAVIGAATVLILRLQIQTFALLAFPYFCLSFDALGKALHGYFKRVSERMARGSCWIGIGLAVVVSLASCGFILTSTYYRSIGSLSQFGLGANLDVVPDEAHILITHEAFPERCFNQPFDGGYLAWRYPERKVFMDTRPGLYSAEIAESGRALARGAAEEVDAFMQRWQVDAFILNALLPDTPQIALRLLHSREWALSYFDGTTLILVRNQAEFAEVVANPSVQLHGLQMLETTRDDYQDAMERPLGAPISPRLVGAASVFYHLQQFPEAEAAYELLLQNVPMFRSAYVPFAISQLQNRHLEAAIETLTQATELMPKNARAFLLLGEAQKAAGNGDLADRAFNRAKSLDPELARQMDAQTQPADASKP